MRLWLRRLGDRSLCNDINKSIDYYSNCFLLLLLEWFHSAKADDELPPLQYHLLNQSSKRVKDCVTRVATEHKELHGGISKIGKAIDRVRINGPS